MIRPAGNFGRMDAFAGSVAVGACPTCGRRYVPARATCSFCGSALAASHVRAHARVLAHTRVHRAPRGAVMTAPYVVAWLQEDGDGAVFLAPLDGDGAVSNGDRIAVEVREWPIEDGGTFAGVVGVPVDA
jgi:uncharacterized OB-fold protein